MAKCHSLLVLDFPHIFGDSAGSCFSKDGPDMSDADAYKDTIFLPKTDFPMRGELPKREPEILKKWRDMDLYARQRELSQGRKKWILHWGPPYANGHAHMGHAF